jgi:hypothetical protein
MVELSIFYFVAVKKCAKMLFYFTEKQKPIVKLDLRFELWTAEKIINGRSLLTFCDSV